GGARPGSRWSARTRSGQSPRRAAPKPLARFHFKEKQPVRKGEHSGANRRMETRYSEGQSGKGGTPPVARWSARARAGRSPEIGGGAELSPSALSGVLASLTSSCDQALDTRARRPADAAGRARRRARNAMREIGRHRPGTDGGGAIGGRGGLTTRQTSRLARGE